MKIISKVCFLLFLAVMFCLPSVSSASTSAGLARIDDEMAADPQKIPEWLKRTRFSIEAGSHIKPKYFFETVQPIYQDMDNINTFFFQPRFSFTSSNSTYNIGVGYRRLLYDNSVLLGINTFWDSKADHDHYRLGVGGEAFLNMAEFRCNGYFALSPRRQYNQDGNFSYYAKAVNGFDVEAGLPVPYMNWIKVYGGLEWYDYKKSKNKEGWQARVQVTPIKHSTINFTAYDSTKGDPAFKIEGNITIPFDTFWGNEDPEEADDIVLVGISDEMYPEKVDHSDRTLDRVERNYEIEIETWAENATATIEIRRGS